MQGAQEMSMSAREIADKPRDCQTHLCSEPSVLITWSHDRNLWLDKNKFLDERNEWQWNLMSWGTAEGKEAYCRTHGEALRHAA